MKVKVTAKPGKSQGGTIIARSVVKVNKTKRPEGKPMFQTRAQVDVHLENKNGQRRR